jgi:signal transduction histidine kinase
MRSGALSTTALAFLVAALFAFGVLSDRALVDQARLAGEAARAAADETARLTALSVRAALSQLEQAVVAGRPSEGVSTERLASPPPRLPGNGSGPSYGSRPRTELVRLLDSRRSTPSGLPEAVVARIALGPGPEKAVEERLLGGRLPVNPDDLPYLAKALGVGDDPRVTTLAQRLRLSPAASSLPSLPAFKRTLVAGTRLEGWSRDGDERIRYLVGVEPVLARAGVSKSVALATGSTSKGGDVFHRVVPVPEVEGLSLSVAVEPPGRVRLLALRAALWLAVLASSLGALAARRALVREGSAMAREKHFLSGVTHELRTPLAAIRLFGETLAEGRGEPREYGAMVAKESERLEVLVERVLAVTRVDEAARFEEANPDEIAASALSLIAPRAQRRSVTVRREPTGEPLSGPCLWDVDAVRRALLNLLDNAVTHGREGGHVDVSLFGVDGNVHIAVMDDGPGISRKHRDGLFTRFFRGESRSPGTGLGLYLVDQVARAHGGRVELATEEGKGATFTLVLPKVPPGARS